MITIMVFIIEFKGYKMKKIIRKILPLITLFTCVPLAAMEKIEKMEKGEIQKPLEPQNPVAKTDHKILESFDAIYTSKKKTVSVEEKKQKEKENRLQENFLEASQGFFHLSDFQHILSNEITKNSDNLTIKKLSDLNPSNLLEACVGLANVTNTAGEKIQKNEKYLVIAQNIIKSTIEELAFYLDDRSDARKRLSAYTTQKKILMLHFGDYWCADFKFLMILAESIKGDIAKDKTLYEKCRNEIENCSFKITKEVWKSAGTTYQKPDLIKQHEDEIKGHDDFVATSRTTDAADTEKTFTGGTESRILTIDRPNHTGTFVFKKGGNVTATHTLENINPLINNTPLDSAGYLFCDGINDKKNCIINLTTGAYYCITTKDTSQWPRDMVNAQYWLPEKIPGYVTTKIVPAGVKKVFTRGPFEIKTLTYHSDSKKLKLLVKKTNTMQKDLQYPIKQMIWMKDYLFYTTTADFNIRYLDFDTGIIYRLPELPDSYTLTALLHNKNSVFMVSPKQIFAFNPIVDHQTIFTTDCCITHAQISPDGTQLVIDEDVDDIHAYHTFDLNLTQVPLAEWLTDSESWPTTKIESTASKEMNEVIEHKKKIREYIESAAAATYVISIIGASGVAGWKTFVKFNELLKLERRPVFSVKKSWYEWLTGDNSRIDKIRKIEMLSDASVSLGAGLITAITCSLTGSLPAPLCKETFHKVVSSVLHLKP